MACQVLCLVLLLSLFVLTVYGKGQDIQISPIPYFVPYAVRTQPQESAILLAEDIEDGDYPGFGGGKYNKYEYFV